MNCLLTYFCNIKDDIQIEGICWSRIQFYCQNNKKKHFLQQILIKLTFPVSVQSNECDSTESENVYFMNISDEKWFPM
jgi:hypothetical protein